MAPGGRSSEWTLWVVAAATTLHATEELITGWLDWAPVALGIRLPAGVFITMNVILSVAAFVLAREGWRRPAASLVIPAATLANAVLFHVLPTIVSGRPAPGIYTACLLYLPFSTWAFVGAAQGGVSRRAIGTGAVLGLAVALGVVIAARAASPPATDTNGGPPSSWPSDQMAGQLTDSLETQISACAGVPLLSLTSIGPLKPGQTLREVLEACPSAVRYWDWGDEGIPGPALAIRLEGALIRVELSDTLQSSLVTRLLTSDSTARTAEGLGPGATLADLERAYGSASFGTAECAIYASWPNRPGSSFVLAFPYGWDCDRAGGIDSGKERPPANSRVAQVIVFRPEQAG